MADLCDEHLAQWDAWSEFRLVAPFSICSHAAYDDSVRGLTERRARRVSEWRETIRFQQRLIARVCAARCGKRAASDGSEVAA